MYISSRTCQGVINFRGVVQGCYRGIKCETIICSETRVPQLYLRRSLTLASVSSLFSILLREVLRCQFTLPRKYTDLTNELLRSSYSWNNQPNIRWHWPTRYCSRTYVLLRSATDYLTGRWIMRGILLSKKYTESLHPPMYVRAVHPRICRSFSHS